MSLRALARLLVAWAALTSAACMLVRYAFALRVDDARPSAIVASVWREGRVVARAVMTKEGEVDAALDAAASQPGATRVEESVVADGPVILWPAPAFAMSFVPGQDGLSATFGGKTGYVTPDDLLALQAYDHGISLPSLPLSIGLDAPLALAAASSTLGVSVRDLLDYGTLRRIRVARRVVGGPLDARAPAARAVTAGDLDTAVVREAAVAMGRYLARGVGPDGRFRYAVNATNNQTLPGYDWPRHAGATYFVTQIAAVTGDADVGFAALRAAALLRDHALLHCGELRCIGEEDLPRVDVGSTALALLCFVEIARTGLDAGYALLVPELSAFLRAQQRADGEFMHLYDRAARHPLDVQLLYYSGEAAFALSRAHALLGDPRDLEAATRALAHLVGPAWSFFGSRYYWGEEHWTCQALDDLGDRAPAPLRASALEFCLGWQDYGRKLMFDPGETPFDADGAYGVGPFVTPRLTPAGSRTEAAIATLEAAMHAGRPAAELATLDAQIRRSLAMLLRHPMGGPGARDYLLADPAAVAGAMPGSEVDWQLRIDYSQHTGSALVRWLALAGSPGR